MSTSELETQINRFKVNEERLNTFVNVDGFYTTSSGVQVPTLLNVSNRIEASVENVSLAEQSASIEITRQTDLVIAASTSAQEEFLNEDSKINTLAKNTIADWQTAINTITQTEGVPALAVSTANNETQQSINDSVGAKWYAKPLGYKLNSRVMLTNGDIVKSTIDENTNNPNVDMTGWENPSLIQREIGKKIPNWNNPKQGVINTLLSNMPFVKLQKTGSMQFNPSVQVDVPAPLEINQSRVNFDGNNGVLKWVAADQTRSIVEVFDSQFVRIRDFMILGDKNNPPLAGIHFKNSTNVALASNNRCSVENVIIGKRYRTDTIGGGTIDEGGISLAECKVQNGVLVTKDGRGNNDEFWLNNVVAHEAVIAGFNFDGDQHIWSSINNSTANGCNEGFRLGSNMALYNTSSNRCVVADVHLIRDVQVSAFGLNAEHAECFVWSQGGGSMFIQGGELQTRKDYDIAFFKFDSGGNLVVRDQFIENIGLGKGFIEYTVGSIKGGQIKIENTYLQGGNLRNTYRIHTATNTYPDATIDIDNGDFFKFKTNHPYHDKAISAATAVNANANARLVAVTASKNGAGKIRINTIDQHFDGVRLIDCLTNNIVDIRAVNTTAGAVTYPATAKIRSLRIDDRITNSLKATKALGNVNASSYKNISISLGARALDHFAVTADNVSGLSSLSLSAQAKSDGNVVVIAENMLASNITSIASLALTVAKLDLGKFNLKTLYEIPSDIAVAAGQTVFVDVPLDNCQMGGHTAVASNFYADGLIYSSSVKENGVVQIAVHNKTALLITVPSGTILSVVCAF